MKKKLKKVAKKSRKKPAKKHIDPHLLLLAKIDRIKARVPHIEPTGECKDESGEVLFHFTEAQHVFEIYREQCDMEGLHYRPYAVEHIQPKAIAIGSMPLVIGTFCIEDRQTGARLIGWGSGMGANRDWSGNTANTRALKQFLLTTFEALWKDPLDPKHNKEQLKAQVRDELIADGTMSAIDELRTYFDNQFLKVKKDAGTKGKYTKSSRRSDSKKA